MYVSVFTCLYCALYLAYTGHFTYIAEYADTTCTLHVYTYTIIYVLYIGAHKQTQPLSFPLSPFLLLSLTLPLSSSLSLYCSPSISLPPSLFLTLPLPLSPSPSLPLSLTLPLSPSLILFLSPLVQLTVVPPPDPNLSKDRRTLT